MEQHELNNEAVQAMNQVLNDYVTENANLRIVIKQLENELKKLKEEKSTE